MIVVVVVNDEEAYMHGLIHACICSKYNIRALVNAL